MSSTLWLTVQLTVGYFIEFLLLFLLWHHVGVYFRHGVEAQSVFVTFASAFLVKVNNIRLLSWTPAHWPSQCSCYNQNSLLTSPRINVLISKPMLKASLIFLLKLPSTIDMARSSILASWRNCWRDLWQSSTQLPQLHHPTLLCHPA